MTRQRLPIGIQDFRRLRETGSYYVDKTPLIRQLVEQGDHYFLSRPRRFARACCWTRWDPCSPVTKPCSRGWTFTRTGTGRAAPVVRLSFDGKYNTPGDIESNILAQIEMIERHAEISHASCTTGPERLGSISWTACT